MKGSLTHFCRNKCHSGSAIDFRFLLLGHESANLGALFGVFFRFFVFLGKYRAFQPRSLGKVSVHICRIMRRAVRANTYIMHLLSCAVRLFLEGARFSEGRGRRRNIHKSTTVWCSRFG